MPRELDGIVKGLLLRLGQGVFLRRVSSIIGRLIGLVHSW